MKQYSIAIFLFICLPFLLISQRTITGKVVAASTGEELIGVAIQLKNTSKGTLTNVSGEYSIEIPEGKQILIFTYAGYTTKEIKVRSNNVINVELEEGVELEEIVVVGYGTSKRKTWSRKNRGKAKRSQAISSTPLSQEARKPLTSPKPNTESYARIEENKFTTVHRTPLSTFSIDVDRAAYSNIRRFIENGEKPPKDAVRIEEMINYFDYQYAQPSGEHPIVVHAELGNCPWNQEHQLLKVGLKAKEIPKDNLPPSNLVFLLDVSGSMSSYNKLPLVKKAMEMLVKQLREQDKVSIVVYAGAAGLVLPPTAGNEGEKIMAAIDELSAGGSTAGGKGIQLAYKVASEQFIENGNNRIIIATDGDFNVGMSTDREMETLITMKREKGIYLTCLGFGMGNYKDSKMEVLANKGNGNYSYIDNEDEAKKVFQTEFSGTMFTLAKDVKFQLEFNPSNVAAYRLIGYENRLLDEEDFADDTKDAGEIGVGHTVTALYEIIPSGSKSKYIPEKQKLKYQSNRDGMNRKSSELMTVKIRYKPMKSATSIKLEYPILNNITAVNSKDFYFASSVSLFGMLLRDSEFTNDATYKLVIELAEKGLGTDKKGYRKEFIEIVEKVNGATLAEKK